MFADDDDGVSHWVDGFCTQSQHRCDLLCDATSNDDHSVDSCE